MVFQYFEILRPENVWIKKILKKSKFNDKYTGNKKDGGGIFRNRKDIVQILNIINQKFKYKKF